MFICPRSTIAETTSEAPLKHYEKGEKLSLNLLLGVKKGRSITWLVWYYPKESSDGCTYQQTPDTNTGGRIVTTCKGIFVLEFKRLWAAANSEREKVRDQKPKKI